MYYSEFPTIVSEKLAYYVYILKDPRDGKIFYIGKGKGNRVFDHVNCALETTHKSDKLDLIREIKSCNMDTDYKILRHGLNEECAYEVESAVIDLYGITNLKNEVRGHNTERGIKSISDLISQYHKNPIERFDEPSLIITINRQYYTGISPEELYEVTRSSWILGEKRNRVKQVICSYNGIVREVYEVESWQNYGKRSEFIGRVASDDIRVKYVNRSLEKFIKVGSQNPVKYTF